MLRLSPRRPHPHARILAALVPDASRSELAALARAGTEVDLPDGHVLMEEGEWGREAYLLLEGAVDISICGSVVNTVSAGEIVGELAIIDPRRPRMATVRAAGPVKALVFDMRSYRSIYDLPGLAPTMTPVARYVAA
jgi:CRP/FNR family cyclic AMP-dependent transcriptional regulator